MGLGSVGLQTSQKKEQSGAPFVSTAAENGLSVDPVTGRIVLGNDVGVATEPAKLINDREIQTLDVLGPFPAKALILSNNFDGATTRMDGATVTMDEILGTTQVQLVVQSSAGGGALISVADGARKVTIQPNSIDARVRSSNFNIDVMALQQVNPFGIQIGATIQNYNSANLQVNGTLTNRRFCTGVGAGTTTVDRDLDSGKIFFNSGARTLNLPNMSGANSRVGFILGAACNSATGITFQADTLQVIRFGSLASSAGGTLSTTDVGAFARIVLINSNTWFTETFCGAWTLT